MKHLDLAKKFIVKFKKSQAEGINAVYKFQIGEEENSYFVKVNEDSCELLQEKPEHANVTLAANEETWSSIINKNLNPQLAFMMGKLSIKGDMNLALKLPNMFDLN